MIDISTESTLSLRDAAKLLPPGRLGRPVSFQCLLRWVLDGARGPDGRLVRLEAIRLGGRYITSREALQRFGESLTPGASDRPVSSPRTPRQRRRAAERAERELEQMGI
jgi:hypothetical protein